MQNTMPCAHLFDAVAFTMEVSLAQKNSSGKDFLERLQSFKCHYLDPRMKTLAATLGRNVHQTSRWCQNLKLRTVVGAWREQRRRRPRHVKVARLRGIRGRTVQMRLDSWAVTGDAFQVAVDKQLWAWMVLVTLK